MFWCAPGFGGFLALAASLWQLLGGGSLVLAVFLGQVLPGCFVVTNRFLGLCRSVLFGYLGDPLVLAVPLWQLLVGGSFTLAALLRDLLTSLVPPGWLVGVGSFLPGVIPPCLSLCSVLLVCLLSVPHTSPVLPHRGIVEAVGGVGPRVRFDLSLGCTSPFGFGGVVWRPPRAWFLAGGCHPGYVGVLELDEVVG